MLLNYIKIASLSAMVLFAIYINYYWATHPELTQMQLLFHFIGLD